MNERLGTFLNLLMKRQKLGAIRYNLQVEKQGKRQTQGKERQAKDDEMLVYELEIMLMSKHYLQKQNARGNLGTELSGSGLSRGIWKPWGMNSLLNNQLDLC